MNKLLKLLKFKTGIRAIYEKQYRNEIKTLQIALKNTQHRLENYESFINRQLTEARWREGSTINTMKENHQKEIDILLHRIRQLEQVIGINAINTRENNV